MSYLSYTRVSGSGWVAANNLTLFESTLTNKQASQIKLKSITIPLYRGVGTVRNSSGSWSTGKASDNVSAVIKIGTQEYTRSVTTNVSPTSTGTSASNPGSFSGKYKSIDRITITLSMPIIFDSGSSITITCKMKGSGILTSGLSTSNTLQSSYITINDELYNPKPTVDTISQLSIYNRGDNKVNMVGTTAKYTDSSKTIGKAILYYNTTDYEAAIKIDPPNDSASTRITTKDLEQGEQTTYSEITIPTSGCRFHGRYLTFPGTSTAYGDASWSAIRSLDAPYYVKPKDPSSIRYYKGIGDSKTQITNNKINCYNPFTIMWTQSEPGNKFTTQEEIKHKVELSYIHGTEASQAITIPEDIISGNYIELTPEKLKACTVGISTLYDILKPGDEIVVSVYGFFVAPGTVKEDKRTYSSEEITSIFTFDPGGVMQIRVSGSSWETGCKTGYVYIKYGGQWIQSDKVYGRHGGAWRESLPVEAFPSSQSTETETTNNSNSN